MLPTPAELARIATLLEEGCPIPLVAGSEQQQLERAIATSREARDELEARFLVVGLLGGTGVGKSTLLNALAGTEISRAGDRRPTTDRVVCYRHRQDPVPEGLPMDDLAPAPEPHEITALRGVTLLDLPDFDSRARSHRDTVHRILPHLDLLLVVTNVEKYADRVLYDEILALPQAPRNLVFVLNAIDRVTPSQEEAIVGDFSEKLASHAQIEAPSTLRIAALETALDPAFDGRGALDELRDLLEELGGESARRAVLSANLEEALGRFADRFHSLWPPADIERLLEELELLAPRPPEPPVGFGSSLEDHLESLVSRWAKDRAQRASWFPIGPAYYFVRKLRRLKPVEDPFRGKDDPLRDFREDLLARPLRLAAERARQRLDPWEGRFDVPRPAFDEGPEPSELERWVERLHRRTRKLAWKTRQHLIPVALALTWLGHLAVSMVPDEDGSWFSSLGRTIREALLTLSPTTLGILAGSLVVYYLAVYPYFLYRLDRAVHEESRRGAAIYLRVWKDAFQERWCDPWATELRGVRAWWCEISDRVTRLSRRTTSARL